MAVGAPRPSSAPQVAATLVPFWLPASHFAAGLTFVSAAATLSFVIAPDLAAGRFLQPHVVGVVHLLTLGWLTLSIMGALCQLFPVALGTPLFSVRTATATLLLFVPAIAAFVIGLFTGATPLVIAAAIAIAVALLAFVFNAGRTLLRSSSRDLSWWALVGACGFLLATIVFGISLAINLRTAHLGTGRLTALAVHVHVALAGWVGLVILAVGRRLLPMFLVSHGTDERALRIATVAAATGAGILALFHRAPSPAVFSAAAACLVTALAAFGFQLFGYMRTRHRPQLDAGLTLIITGVVFLMLSAPLGVSVLVASSPRLIATYGVALLGGFMLFVAGHYYKILPFLLWNHRFAPLAGKRNLPKIADLYSASLAALASRTAIAGMTGLLGGVALQSSLVARGGAALLAAGIITEAYQLLTLLRMRPA